jgi:transposase
MTSLWLWRFHFLLFFSANHEVVSTVNGIVVKRWQTVALPDTLANQLNSLYPHSDIYTAYEAGFSGFVLHRALEQAGIHNLVVNPGSIEGV